MSKEKGFLVVLKSSEQIQHSYNPKYRGLYRTRPFYIEEYEKELNDPYFAGKYTDDHGLIPNLPFAAQVLAELVRMDDHASFEIIYVKDWEGASTLEDSSGFRFLGFDVACYSPFWSIVADSPNPEDPEVRAFLTKLNEYGLFSSGEEAESYREAYLNLYPNKQELILRIWEVYLV
ncbi:MAG: hypothetical protein EYC68_14970 [Chloroflexota bacterium]|nr:MAG: hypothetical protein EYC68_14970 [Chloroflexota bacterium]